MLESLDAADWDVVVPDCPDWTVADMVGHLLGAARAHGLRRCALAPRAVAGRMRLPAPLRRLNIPMSQGGSVVPGMPSRLDVGNLVDAILTRDVWMHRCDIARVP